jgi:hypothetical protein
MTEQVQANTDVTQQVNATESAPEVTQTGAPDVENTESTSVESPEAEQSTEDVELPEPDLEESGEVKETWPKGVAERMKRLNKKLQQKDLELQQIQAQLQQVAQPAPQQPQPLLNEIQLPQREDFASEHEYHFALSDYRDAIRQQQQIKMQQQQAQEKAFTEYRKNWQVVNEKGAEKYSDYEDVVAVLNSPEFKPNIPLCKAIMDVEFGSDILYFLGKNKAEALKINSLDPIKAVMKVAELNAKFEAKRKPNVSKTPKPLAPVNTAQSASSPLNGDPNKMSPQEYRAWYEENFRRKKRA